MTDDQFVRLFQERAAAAGYYTGGVDGIAGAGTLRALDKALPPLVIISEPPVEKPDGTLPDAAEAKLKGVHEALADVIRQASVRSVATPFTIVEGLRTKERQAQLVKAGASKTQNSRHLTGHAVDLWPVSPGDGKPLPSDAAFARGSAAARKASDDLWNALRQISATVKLVARERGVLIEWGGDWGWDAPHFQLNRVAFP